MKMEKTEMEFCRWIWSAGSKNKMEYMLDLIPPLTDKTGAKIEARVF